MANENTYRKLTLTGKISDRARTFTGEGKDGNPYSKTNFALTEGRQVRVSERDGQDYNADDRWTLSIMGNEDSKTQELLKIVSDLDIGDEVTVDVAVLPRKGFPFFRVLDVRNSAQ
jgi:hypothetical protein